MPITSNTLHFRPNYSMATSLPQIDTHVLLIDNYDSFVYNLYQYMCEYGARVTVIRNDELSVEECVALQPDRLLISPGPGHPRDAGISCDLIRAFAGKIPISGVCLGLQCMFEVYGGTVGYAGEIVHGKQADIWTDSKGLFEGLPRDLKAVRYHSLVGLRETLPECLEVSATLAGRDMIMGIRHREYLIEGVQFHPESILTEEGKMIIFNFLKM
jgi:anthranilate synthase / indole-3-glycerol phosphate synthase